MLKKTIFEANEHSSVLPTMKQVTPSNRVGLNDEGVGDRSDVGKKPVDGQAKIFGNLNNQSRGMVGKLDTQGKDSPVMFTDHKNSKGCDCTGTYTPSAYKKMLKESSCGSESGVQAGKQKINTASGKNSNVKYVENGDTNHSNKVLSESDCIGSILTLSALQIFNESHNININSLLNKKK